MVSDETPGGAEQSTKKPRKELVRLSPTQWAAARFDYENGALGSHSKIAARYDVSLKTVRIRAKAEGWQKGAKVAANAEKRLAEVTTASLEKAGEQLAERLVTKFENGLAPWFEREKRKHVKDSVRRSKDRQKMLDKLTREITELTPKDAAFIARSDDIYDNIKRRNLGMSDGIGVGGALNLSILTNQAAVQVVSK